METRELDKLTRQYTAFSSFADLTDSTAADYFPTLTEKGSEVLADAYDAAMAERGDSRRAWRGKYNAAELFERGRKLIDEYRVQHAKEIARSGRQSKKAAEALRRQAVRRLFLNFAKTADAVELGVLYDALAHWSAEYPKANHEEELVISTSMNQAVRSHYQTYRETVGV